jgi:hypothetical protein
VEHRPSACGQVLAPTGRRRRRRSVCGSVGPTSRARAGGTFRNCFSQLGQIDLFVHDLQSERNVRFELDRAWAAMAPKGAIVVDDVDANWGFRSFTLAFPAQRFMIGEAEPVRPDFRRFNKKGLLGIIRKQPAAQV